MKKIKITLVKSPIDRSERQKLTVQALGLNKTNSSREVEATPQILGMVRKLTHLLKVEEVKKQLKSSKKIIHKTQGGEP